MGTIYEIRLQKYRRGNSAVSTFAISGRCVADRDRQKYHVIRDSEVQIINSEKLVDFRKSGYRGWLNDYGPW